jgi:hypothetical protein
VAGEIDRRVERRDAGDDTDRKAQHEADFSGAHGAGIERNVFAFDADRLFGRQREGVLRTHDLGLGVLDRLAGLPRHDRGDGIRPFDQQLGGTAQESGALVSRLSGGFRFGFDGGIEGIVEIGHG